NTMQPRMTILVLHWLEGGDNKRYPRPGDSLALRWQAKAVSSFNLLTGYIFHVLCYSDIAEDVVLRFTGESAEEAEDFIQAVNQRAYAAGKQKDYTWIAEFAYPFFSRKALRWYDNLDEATQNDWKLLRSAILAEFTGQQSAPSAVPSAGPAVTRYAGHMKEAQYKYS
ncbi:hypothetical protein FRC01_007640, partial [Tulasnella sp. 417]